MQILGLLIVSTDLKIHENCVEQNACKTVLSFTLCKNMSVTVHKLYLDNL